MSFILDALRKSELERQRGAAARIMRLPIAQREGARVPVWVTALIVVLALSVLALAGTAWRGWHERATAAATAAAKAVPAPAPRPAPEASTGKLRQGGAAAASADEQRGPQAAAQHRHRAAKDSAADTTAAAAARKQATQAQRPPAPPADPAALPSVDELAADGAHVPALTLQLHVYSKNPKQRFVFIDGTRYQEGEKTAEGPVLVAVTPKGAVLSEHGREFFVPTQ